jgi:membrane protease YdiL (CAAX protease family)
MVFLSLRRLPATGYRFTVSGMDLATGARWFLWLMPVVVALAWSTGFASWGPRIPSGWTAPFVVAANALGIYAAVALAEEMYFRGVLQNLLAARLRHPQTALVLASLLFGLSHLGRGFPNWRYAAVATVAGWFYGRAYLERHSVVAAAVTHTLVVLAHRYLFS